MKKDKLSRRDFLKVPWVSLWGFVLAACKVDLDEESPSSPTPKPTATNTNTPEPEPKKDSAPVVEEEPTPTNTPTETPPPCFSLLSPENEIVLPEIGKVIFSWQPMQGAEKYAVEFMLPSGQTVIFEATETSHTRYIETFLAGGVFMWQVTAFDNANTVLCSTEPFTFEKPAYTPPASKNNGGGDGGSGEIQPPPGHTNGGLD